MSSAPLKDLWASWISRSIIELILPLRPAVACAPEWARCPDLLTLAFLLPPFLPEIRLFTAPTYVPWKERRLISAHVGDDEDLDIPAGESNVRHDGFYRLKENAHITAFQAHLHNLGKRQCLGAIFPDNSKEILSCADWDFGWHIVYNYEDTVAPLLPKGTLLHVTSWHDNSDANRWNDDSTNWAGFGQRSSDEMSFSWVSWYELNDEEFEAEVDERQALADNNNN